MSAATILTLANLKGIDLLDPRASDIHFESFAEQLAKEKRYNGSTPGEEYSVAEHLARGVDAVLADGGDETLAAYFSLHDAHEAVVKDLTTPLKQAIGHIAGAYYDAVPTQIIDAFGILEHRIDAAIYDAAGVPWPTPQPIRPMVKRYDLIMFVTEWRDLMGAAPHPNWAPYSGIKPLEGKIIPWRWETAKRALLDRWTRLLPALRSTRVEERSIERA